MARTCKNCGAVEPDDLVFKCVKCGASFSLASPGNVPLSPAQEVMLYKRLRNRFIADVWRISSILFSISIVGIAVGLWQIWGRAKTSGEKYLYEKVAEQFKDKKVQETLTAVATNQAAEILRREITPTVAKFKSETAEQARQFQSFMQTQVGSLSQQVATIPSVLADNLAPIKKETERLLGDIGEARKEIDVLSLYFDALQGNSAARDKLSHTAGDQADRAGRLAASMRDALWLAEEKLRKDADDRSYISGRTMKHMRPPAEVLAFQLVNEPTVNQKRAVINEIADRDLKYLVEDLVRVVKEDANWIISARAVRAIEKLSGSEFSHHAPYNDVAEWWEHGGNTNEVYRGKAQQFYDRQVLLDLANDDDSKLRHLEALTRNRGGLCISHYEMALIYLRKDAREKAKEHLKIATNECDGHVESLELYAKLLCADGEKQKAVDLLKKARIYSSDKRVFDEALRKDDDFKGLREEKSFNDIFQ